MKQIPLTQGQVALVDDADFERFGHLKWKAWWSKSIKQFYAIRIGPHPLGRTIFLHREIYGANARTFHLNKNTRANTPRDAAIW